MFRCESVVVCAGFPWTFAMRKGRLENTIQKRVSERQGMPDRSGRALVRGLCR